MKSLLALLGIPIVAAAPAFANSSLVGTWEATIEGQSYVLTLDAGGGGRLMDQAIQWSASGDLLQVAANGGVMAYRYVLKGDQLIVSDGGPMSLTLTRRGAGSAPPAVDSAAPAAGTAPADLVGKWKDPNGAVIELRADGTGTNARGDFHWQAAQGYFHLVEANLLLRYEMDGATLTVTGQDGTMSFERAPADAKVGATAGDRSAATPAGDIVVNGTKMTPAQVTKFEQTFRIRMMAGRYWYDARCGAWGMQGGPCVGFLPAGLDLGGPLAADASGGMATGVFINGRQLHPQDVAALQQMTPVYPGRYWVDATGNCGIEGSPVPLVNLVQLAQAARSQRGGSYISRNEFTGIGTGGDGKTSYVMGKDWSVIVGE
jgi:hypothetical protein